MWKQFLNLELISLPSLFFFRASINSNHDGVFCLHQSGNKQTNHGDVTFLFAPVWKSFIESSGFKNMHLCCVTGSARWEDFLIAPAGEKKKSADGRSDESFVLYFLKIDHW